MTHSPLLLVLDALAVFRGTQLVVYDSITQPLRDWVGQNKERSPNRPPGFPPIRRWPKWYQLVSCPWCVSPYIGGGVVLLQSFASGPWVYVACIAAFSAVAGLLSELK